MLVELAVRDLGVIAELRLVLGPGMTVLTGETGAGKTMVVDAIELLVGGRADPVLVRTGADEAWVEGRFVRPGAGTGSDGHGGGDGEGDEGGLARAIPRSGRSRAYIDGRLATVGELAAVGAELVDLHGQHAHQSLLHVAAQREALDRFGGVDRGPLHAAREEVRSIVDELATMGGDERARARELDLLRYQVSEIDGAAITGPDEDAELERLEDELADAAAHREAAAGAVVLLSGDGVGGGDVPDAVSATDAVGSALALVAGRSPFADNEAPPPPRNWAPRCSPTWPSWPCPRPTWRWWSAARIPATTWSCGWPPTPARRRCRWPRWPRVANWRGPCSRCVSCSPPHPRPWCSTRSTPASAAPPPWPLAAPWPASQVTTRCWWSPTCPRWPRTPTPRCGWPSRATRRPRWRGPACSTIPSG